ncbi:helix-turn-helix domain-containing protein [Streptomyces griseosporeus]|uniref:helix-turn-helix domain-containing protein n=1 Tax=Streptomyces griseosporeus TaxID=1910 RepID=UPI001E4BA990|nr:LysR family transcriptional regulator [Streptomyces griseosporeus]
MEVIVAVADTGGFTAAARNTWCSPRWSGTVRSLERELGQPCSTARPTAWR